MTSVIARKHSKENKDGDHSQARPFHRRRTRARLHVRDRAAGSAAPQQINPTADAVKEQKLLSELNRITGRCTLPDQKACTLEQPAGRDWRPFHERTLPIIGAISIIGMLLLLVLFYMIRGMVRIEAGPLRPRDRAVLDVRAAGALDDGKPASSSWRCPASTSRSASN